jgi:hypothetical protein
LRAFTQKNVREKDLKLFADMAKEAGPAKPEDLSLRVLVPAFMISELKRAFRNRVSAVSAISDHRPCCGLGAHVDGHDDAATRRGIAAVQTDLLRAG